VLASIKEATHNLVLSLLKHQYQFIWHPDKLVQRNEEIRHKCLIKVVFIISNIKTSEKIGREITNLRNAGI
jgi:hypothetical protein